MRRVVVTVALVLVAGCSANSKYAALRPPKTVKLGPTTSSTASPNLDEIALPGVAGTTTTTPTRIGPGPVTIVGRVDGPDGPVAGAIVQLDRMVGDRVVSLQVPTAADGTWNAQNVLGGRYRIRAWMAPTLAMAQGQLVFVDARNPPGVTLRLDRFTGTVIDAAIAPNPPTVGQSTNLSVRVVLRQVDTQGFVRNVPEAGVTVTLTGSGSWSTSSGNPSSTGSDGVASFVMQCLQEGDQPLSAELPDGTAQPLNLPPCSSPASTTTTAGTSSNTTSTTSKKSTPTTKK